MADTEVNHSGAVAAQQTSVIVVGGGPAGLMAAQVLAEGGAQVHVYDAMPSVGRKFLLAGKGGLNLTHSEPLASFLSRYGSREEQCTPWIEAFGPDQVRAWAKELGVDSFVGSSGRVFPTDMKAAPLLRAWLQRLRQLGVQFHMRHRWLGWDAQGQMRFASPEGEKLVAASTVVLALGGASWARLGSDGAWAPLLQARGVDVAKLQPSNCGFDVLASAAASTSAAASSEQAAEDAPADASKREFLQSLIGKSATPVLGWSAHFSERFAGQPFKAVAIHFTDSEGRSFRRRGEFVATQAGVEGSLVYAVSALLRDEIHAKGHATFTLDLLPDHTPERVLAEVRHPRGSRSLSSHLKSRLGLDGIKAAILYEQLGKAGMVQSPALAQAIKALPITVVAARPIDEAISTAGGVALEALSPQLMASAVPGLFLAGEMLDWEAPTGGYLLTACLASGRVAGQGALAQLATSAAA